MRWVSPDRYHVTLEFIGEIGEDSLSIDTLKAKARAFDAAFPVACRATAVTGFPTGDRARVVVVEIDSDGALEQIVGREDAKMHVTLGYVRRGRVTVAPLELDYRFDLAHAGLYVSHDGRYQRVD